MSSTFSTVSAQGMPLDADSSLVSSQNGSVTSPHPGMERSASSRRTR
ncbi:MAG TPA: hypothetical protein VFJ85_04595 [Acidimicrobiales bacterium]|nr:hypothetical protein [Acidimicrobiales bacterium]